MWMHKPYGIVRAIDDVTEDGTMWSALESQSWESGSGGSPLDGLQLPDWSESGVISSNESLTGIGGLADPELQLPHWGCQSPPPGAPSAQQPTYQPPLVTFNSADISDEALLYPAMRPLTLRDSALSMRHSSERCHEYEPTNPQPCLITDCPPLGQWAASNELASGKTCTEASSLDLIIDPSMRLARGSQADMHSVSSPAELPSHHGWMSASTGPWGDSSLLQRSWSSGCPGSGTPNQALNNISIPKRTASTGSNDSISLALKRLQGAPARLPRAPTAFPLLSHASLGVQPIITPLPSSLEIMPLSSGLIMGALDILPAAFDSQEPDIIKLPSLPKLAKLHSLPRFARAAFLEDALSPPGVAATASNCSAGEAFEAVKEQPNLAPQTDHVGTAATHPLLGSGASNSKAPNQELSVPETPQGSRRTLPVRALPRRAAKRRRAMCESGSDEGSDWAPGAAAPRAGGRAGRALPAPHAEAVPDAVLRNRVTQREYLQRKKGRVAAMHAHVPALEVRLAELRAELAPLLDRHQALTEALPWAQQLDEVQFVASLGSIKAACMKSKKTAFHQRYQQDPIEVCKSLFGRLVGREPDGYAAELAGLPDFRALEPVDTSDIMMGSGRPKRLPLPMPEVLAKLRLNRGQKEQLALQGKENAAVLAMHQGHWVDIAGTLQALLRAPLESTHLGWRSSLLLHVLCGRLAGMERHRAEAFARSLSTCTEVLNDCQAVRFASLTDKHPGAAVALCAEVAGARLGCNGPQRPCAAVASRVLNIVDIA